MKRRTLNLNEFTEVSELKVRAQGGHSRVCSLPRSRVRDYLAISTGAVKMLASDLKKNRRFLIIDLGPEKGGD